MKTLFKFLPSVALCLCIQKIYAQNLEPGKFHVVGTIDTIQGIKFYSSYQIGNDVVIDSFKIAANKEIRFSGSIIEPVLIHINLTKSGIDLGSKQLVGKYSFWVEPGHTTHFTAKTAMFKASGTKSQEEQDLTDKHFLSETLAKNNIIQTGKNARANGTFNKIKPILDKKWDSIELDKRRFVIDFINQHPKSFVSIDLIKRRLTDFKNYNASDQLVAAFDGLSNKLKSSIFAKPLKEKMGLEGKLAIGALAPDFTEPNTQGKPVKLSSYRGKYLLVDFWASWCVPCRAENPNLKKAYEKYQKKGFDILSVSLDDKKAAWLKAVKEDALGWMQVSDLKGFKGSAGILYNIHAIPDNYLIDKKGQIVVRNLRGDELEKKLAELLN